MHKLIVRTQYKSYHLKITLPLFNLIHLTLSYTLTYMLMGHTIIAAPLYGRLIIQLVNSDFVRGLFDRFGQLVA